MLQGKSLSEIGQAIQDQLKTKKDFIVPTSFLAFTVAGNLKNKASGKEIPVNEYAHRQIAAHLGIPQQYYQRMLTTAPELLSQNANRWWEESAKSNERRMIRTMDGRCRAYLSDRYMPIDHADILKPLLPELYNAGCEVVSAEITEKRLYIKAVTPRITGEIKVGDRVQAGILITNSEIGAGRVSVSPLMYRLVCSNGLIVNDLSTKRHHVGRRIKEEDLENDFYYSRETIAADVKAFLFKARDAVRAALNEAIFTQIVNKARHAASDKITVSPNSLVEDVTDRFSLSDTETSSFLQNLIEGGDLTRWGAVNAITAAAHNTPEIGYDRSVELEQFGGELLTMPNREWDRIALAA